ncbi:uncharacterized protein LOC132655893 isoform X2 [Meriones unguiculatus]|uniref:uncharacterized protein LOC132655893 isoform X2 n=1 Tax=Meriones unguiculatus TaxID=10047 RepID=UPI00293EA5F2|nr:uncharacterized protein LOC132655893 isoform X2 [Meriones unguiculatus]
MKLAKQTKTGKFLLRKQPPPVEKVRLPMPKRRTCSRILFWPEMVRRKSMKKPRSVGEKKVEAKKQLPEQTEQNLAKSVGRQDRYSCGAGERRETLKHAPPIFVGRDN